VHKKILYLDLIGGAAGDMIFASLVDAGASLELARASIAELGLREVVVETRVVQSAGLRARQIDVMIHGELADQEAHDHEHHHHDEHHHHHRSYREIRELLRVSGLAAKVKDIALDAFRRLAEGEARAHGVEVEEVVFHEVGADDAIADIVGVATLIAELSPDEIVVSPVPIARGLTQGAHGPIPLPGPATMHILLGAPLAETPLKGEMVTPTGAALLRAIATRFGPIPSMTVEAIGVGAGHRSWPDRPNVVRALVGKSDRRELLWTDDECVIEANIDDMSPQHFAPLERALFGAGALDVWSQPIQMKKARIGVLVSALAPRRLSEALSAVFFAHSTTIGVRVFSVARLRVERRIEEVETPYGKVRVKLAWRSVGPEQAMPEHDDCERLAAEAGLPISVVFEAAQRAAWSKQAK
jgi:pyridinium-3,5-bisthiocarboxylic acid mononucleotide nickel chelatase